MEQWKILALGMLRLGLNTDYDRVHELANHHDNIRQMLGHGGWEDKTTYSRQTIKGNLCLFTPEILDEINQWAGSIPESWNPWFRTLCRPGCVREKHPPAGDCRA